MVRLAGVILPQNKRIEIGLTYVYGIGRTRSNEIIETLKLDKNMRIKDLTEDQVALIQSEVKKYMLEGDLRRQTAMDVKRLQEIGTYRGYRHKRGLPVRGQRTKTNGRTKRGKRRTIANKKKD